MSERLINIAGFHCRPTLVLSIRTLGRRVFVDLAGQRGLNIKADSEEEARSYAQHIADMVNDA